jgi:hypothetical protein
MLRQRTLQSKSRQLIAVRAQALKVDDRHPAIFEPQQSLSFELLQALVGILPGDA